MSRDSKIITELRCELDETRARLTEAEEALEAIRSGEVDALVVTGSQGEQVFTLKDAQEPYRLLIEQMSEGAVTLSQEGVVLYANQTFARLLQRPLERVIGAEFRAFFSPADQPAIAGWIEETCHGFSHGDVSGCIANGSLVPLRLGMSRMHLAPGTWVCVVVTDLTESNRKEDELRQLQAGLEKRVEERTVDLAVSRLAALNIMEEAVEARKALEVANAALRTEIAERQQVQHALRESEALKQSDEQVWQNQAELAHALRLSTISEMASNLAHELNQPLSSIANGVEACARYVRSGKVKSSKLLTLLDEASSEALRAGSIVEHVRSFIQQREPRFGPADLREIARGIPRLLGREIQQEQITFQLDSGKQPLPIHADRVQIEQVIVNLMQNAIDAIREAPDNDRKIQLRTRAVNGRAELSVNDSGVGLPEGATERLFEPFFTTKPHGLGMGLAISRSIIEAHHGRIWVECPSDGRSGTTLCITLPLSPSVAQNGGST